MANNVIRSYFRPTIELEELSEPDGTHGTDGDEPAGKMVQDDVGKTYPLLKANGTYFQPSDILSFELDTTGFIPTFSAKVQAGTQTFASLDAPVDGDIAQVFLKASSEVIKPIRIDFLITNIRTTKTSQEDMTGATMVIEGKMNIPHIYDEVSQAYDGTSFEVLQKIAKELGLGFSSNVSTTDDKMRWVCPFKSKDKFIQEITDAAWTSPREFYTSFIDVYYNLNFVEVNAQMQESEPFKGEVDDLFTKQYSDVKVEEKMALEKRLSNHSQYKTTQYGIETYKPLNNASDLSRKYGYVYKLKFFDYSSMKPYEFAIEPLASDGAASEKMLMKGKPHDNSYLDQSKTNYLGVQYPDNMHEMYYYAKAHNMMNMVEIDKMNISVTLTMFNLNFIRYDSVPVSIFIGGGNQQDAERAMQLEDEKVLSVDGSDDPVVMKPVLDKFYSGTYVLKGYKIMFKQHERVKEEMILAKREWAKQYI